MSGAPLGSPPPGLCHHVLEILDGSDVDPPNPRWSPWQQSFPHMKTLTNALKWAD